MHPFHTLMHEGRLTPRQLQGWVANRFAYQRSIPRKDGAILSNCPVAEVRREWLQRIIDQTTEPWGIKVSLMEVRDVILPDTMKRVMAKQAETERERRAEARVPLWERPFHARNHRSPEPPASSPCHRPSAPKTGRQPRTPRTAYCRPCR